MKYYISDLHFYHKNIIKYENRPFSSVEEMNAKLIECWNKKITDKDEVYILGDFAFCDGVKANNLLKSLKGKKYLITGNHDTFLKDKSFDKSLFERITPYFTVYDNQQFVVLCHYPMAVWDKRHYGAIHLYGHVHSAKDNNGNDLFPILKELDNAYNVGVDVIGNTPLTLKKIIK